jgi:serine phosphatase RsbU (regulator of sigma subunit)
MLITGLKCFFSGKKAARFFVIAWSSYLLGALLIGFRNFGLLPSNFITSHAIQIGSILEVFLLSLALGDRYRIFKEEKEKAQEDLLRVQHEAKEALEVKVKERTEELNEANEELSQTNEELSITLEQLNHQKIVVQEKNEDILASITYAKRIQMAMLPFTEKMNACLKEYFILYKPRDIVSGDFYWVDKIGDKITIVVGDCTGHGVPGAFMSVLGMSYLEEIIIAKHITTPNIILEMLNKGIRYALKQDTTDSRDGMDVAILIIDSSSQIFEFAGAMNPLYFVSDNQLTEIKGDKLPIGGTQREPNRFFNNHALVLKPNTTFYLCTDGYQDQFGGGKGKKFMVKRLKEMLTNISIEPLNKQHEILDTTINNWIVEGKEAQIDDITILGLRV